MVGEGIHDFEWAEFDAHLLAARQPVATTHWLVSTRIPGSTNPKPCLVESRELVATLGPELSFEVIDDIIRAHEFR